MEKAILTIEIPSRYKIFLIVAITFFTALSVFLFIFEWHHKANSFYGSAIVTIVNSLLIIGLFQRLVTKHKLAVIPFPAINYAGCYLLATCLLVLIWELIASDQTSKQVAAYVEGYVVFLLIMYILPIFASFIYLPVGVGAVIGAIMRAKKEAGNDGI